MKIIFQILFFVLVIIPAFAQEVKMDTITQQKEKKWSIGISSGLVYAFPTYTFYGEDKTDLMYGMSAVINHKVSKYSIFETGVSFDYLEYHTAFDEIAWIRKDVFKFSLFYVPLICKIHFGKSRVSGSIDPGLQVGFLLDNKVISYRPDKVEFSIYKNGAFALFANLGVQLNYSLTKKISIFLKPQISTAIVPIYYSYVSSVTGTNTFPNYLKYWKCSFGINYNL
ncbi:MAG: hypothetical protein AABZ74_11955 [Cyanobacteriota bacterium]